jgi:hypothetical protein
VVNIITKSGTEKYHGDLFEYLRNRVFNAHDHFSTVVQNGVLTPYTDPLKRNQFGGTFGGPLEIPHLWKANEGFFFGGFQGSRWRDTSATTSSDASLPSTGNQAGQFPFTATGTVTTANCIVDPASSPKACFPYTNVSGNNYVATIPTTRFDKASLALLNYIPVRKITTSSSAATIRTSTPKIASPRATSSTSSTSTAFSILKTTSPIRTSPTFSI